MQGGEEGVCVDPGVFHGLTERAQRMRIAVVNKMPGKIYPYNLQRVNAGLGLGVKIGA